MPRRIQVNAGDRYGKLTVVSEANKRRFPSGKSDRQFNCICECGKTLTVCFTHLRSGHTKACGCQRGEDHGKKQTRTYRIWRNIKTRCLNPNSPEYQRYGKRGISICTEWKQSFTAFLADMGECPKGLSIERIDNDGDYCPGNCKWATASEQAKNRRTTRWITHNGETLCLSDWARKSGIHRKTLSSRLSKGLSMEEAINGKA